MRHFLIATGLLVVLSDTAHAYVDPGVGGMFYQIVILVIGVIAGYFAVAKRFLRRILRRDTDEEDT
jgi:hypothetical protein